MNNFEFTKSFLLSIVETSMIFYVKNKYFYDKCQIIYLCSWT